MLELFNKSRAIVDNYDWLIMVVAIPFWQSWPSLPTGLSYRKVGR